MNVQLRTKTEIGLLRRANMIVFEIHQALGEMVKPGATTSDLDRRARELCVEKNAAPAFLNYTPYPGAIPFPGVICASINEEIVHGIPSKRRLEEGDIVSIDFGVCCEGYFGDAAVSYAVGKVIPTAEKLLKVTERSLEDAIEQCRPGNRIGDISNAVQQRVESNGFGVIREFVGHGIGTKMHEPPHVPNFGRAGTGRVLRPGLVIAIEPMVTVGSFETKILDDGWTAVTRDGSLAAHFEHTIAITNGDPYVLSRP